MSWEGPSLNIHVKKGTQSSVLVLLIEEHTVVTTPETETSEWRFDFFYIAGAVRQEAIHSVENLHRGFAIDGANIGAGLG